VLFSPVVNALGPRQRKDPSLVIARPRSCRTRRELYGTWGFRIAPRLSPGGTDHRKRMRLARHGVPLQRLHGMRLRVERHVGLSGWPRRLRLMSHDRSCGRIVRR
jgi:hypothetical protein